MKQEIITYIIAPIITLVVGWFGRKYKDDNVQRKENMSALKLQEQEINNLYTQLIDIRKKGREKVKSIEGYYEEEMTKFRRKLNAQSLKIRHYRDNCNCPENEQPD